MNKLKSSVLASFALILILSTIVFASSTTYSTTTPTFGAKTAASGTKSTTVGSLTHRSDSSSGEYYKWWVDADWGSGWQKVTSEYVINPGDSLTKSYSSNPQTGTDVRLRISNEDGMLGGQQISGWINFN